MAYSAFREIVTPAATPKVNNKSCAQKQHDVTFVT